MKSTILKTSLERFLKLGIREVSIQKLVEPLGISTKTVYKYFANKEELLESALHLLYDQQFDLLKNLSLSKNTVQLFVDVWYIALSRQNEVKDVFHEDLQYYYPELKEKIERSISKKFNAQFISIIERGVKEGVFEKKINSSLVLSSIYALLNGITRGEALTGVSQEELFRNSICMYIKGICTSKGVEKLEIHLATLAPLDKKTISKEIKIKKNIQSTKKQ